MFWCILSSSLRHQRTRLSIAVLAMALGTALVSGLLNLSGDIGGQVGNKLRAYGANIIIRPREQSLTVGSGGLKFGTITTAQTIAETDLASIKQIEDVIGVVPYLYAVVEAKGHSVILTGVDLPASRSLNTWWQVQGRWSQTADEILLGVRAAKTLGLTVDETLTVGYGDRTQTFHVAGLLETGGAEDDQLVANLSAAQALTSRPGQVELVMVSALTAEHSLDVTVRKLQTSLPNVEVQTLTQFAQAEATMLNKVRLLIGLVAALVLIAGALTVAGTLNTIVIERRAEIGLMKALGASDRRVAGLFLVEALSVGIFGGAMGYVIGVALAVGIGWQVFEAMIAPTLWGLPGTLLIGLAVALVAGVLPVRGALQIDPVKTLRGD